jgi:hypothetical protein
LDFIGLDLIWIYIAISNPFITGKLGFKDGNNSFETEPNQFEQVFVLKKQNRNWSV